jgi:oxygen-independent coproporphyrinogen III oxidase
LPGIYISWPFCAQKCTYCNFASGVQPRGLEAEYTQALRAEIRQYAWEWAPETLYIGGGTPSGIEPETFSSLLADLPGRPWREATLEAAPGSLSREKIEAWIGSGINRLSLGVQSFNKAELARTGRRHDATTVETDVELLRAAGVSNINLDLIAGLPGQTEASWRDSLASVVRLGVPHVSVYMLEVDDDSRLGSEIILGGKRYGAFDVPDEERIAGFYEYAAEELARHGIYRYEISNFAKPGFESPHNLKYWRRESYIGFGSDAHSFDGESRWQNVETAQQYVEHWRRDETARIEITRPDATEEKFFVGLRLQEGVAPDSSDWQRFGPTFERFLAGGIMERIGDRLRLTPRGIMVSNEVFQEFLTA